MTGTADKSNPKLWAEVKEKVTREGKGGRPGQWSARKAQLAVHDYKERGGTYEGAKTADNHLAQWTKEEWGTKSGENSGTTGERYLPKRARATLTEAEYRETTAKKRADTAKGKQFSAQPAEIAAKSADVRLDLLTVAELKRRAGVRGIVGRSRMRKPELLDALHRRG